ncbi:hypothetical protein JCM10207_007358 [Rhodosporidiobolus poonsookiae]
MSGRTPFTEKDKDRFAVFLSQYPSAQRQAPSTHKEAALRLPNHTWQSWHEHYRKKRDDIERRIALYKRKKKRESDAADENEGGRHVSSSKGKGKARRQDDDSDSAEEESDDDRPAAAGKRKRVEFDDEVDWVRLVKGLADKVELGWTKKQLWEIMEERHPDHTASSWQTWYAKNASEADEAAANLCRSRKKKRTSLGSTQSAAQPEKARKAARASTSASASTPGPAVAAPQASTSASKKPETPAAKPRQSDAPVASSTKPRPSTFGAPAEAATQRRPSTSTSATQAHPRPSTSQQPPAATVAGPSGSARREREAGPSDRVAEWVERGARDASPAPADSKGKGKGKAKEPAPPRAVKPLPRPTQDEDGFDVDDEDDESAAEPAPFTDEDDDLLVHWKARAELNGWAPENVFIKLAELRPAHSADAWQAYYKDNLASLLVRVGQKVLEVQEARTRKREEAERVEREKAEQERRRAEAEAKAAAEKEAERVRLAAEEKAREERERDAREKAERERLEAERREQERLEAEQREKEERERVEQERVEKERIEQERVAAAEKTRVRMALLEAQRVEYERVEKEKEAQLRREEEEKRKTAAPPPAVAKQPPAQRAADKAAAASTSATRAAPSTAKPASRTASASVLTPRTTPPSAFAAATYRPPPRAAAADEDDPFTQAAPATRAGALDDDWDLDQDDVDAEETQQPAFTQSGQAPPTASGSSLPRLSQYSTMPSPFLGSEHDGELEFEEVDELDDSLDSDLGAAAMPPTSQQSATTDESDLQLERSLQQQVGAGDASAAGAMEVEIAVEERVVEVEVKVEQPMQVDAATQADGTETHEEGAESEYGDDEYESVWNALTAEEETFVKQIHILNRKLEKLEKAPAPAPAVKLESGLAAPQPPASATPLQQVDTNSQPLPSAAPAVAASRPRSPSPPAVSPQNKKRPRSERQTSSATPTGPGAAQGKERGQPARKRARLGEPDAAVARTTPSSAKASAAPVVEQEKPAAPAQLAHVVVPLASGAPPPPPPPAPASAAPAPAAVAVAPPAVPAKPTLRERLDAISQEFRLSLATLRNLHFGLSATGNWALVRDCACFFSSSCPDEGTSEHARLKARVDCELWTHPDDVRILEGTDDAIRVVEERHVAGDPARRGAVNRRRRFLAKVKMTKASELRRSLYEL